MFSESLEMVVTSLPTSKDLICESIGIDNEEIDYFLDFFSLNRNFSNVNEFEKVQFYPLIEIENSVIFIDKNVFLDQVFYRLDQGAKTRPYFQDYQRSRGEYLERQIETHFLTLFKSGVYSTVDYNFSGSDTAELDLIILCEPYILLVEAKSSQYRFESQMGNRAKLKKDIKKNITDAYSQGLRALNYIKENDTPVFTVRDTGEVINIDKSKYSKYIISTISLNYFAGIATRLSSLEETGIFTFHSELPWATCLVELDLISRFLKDRSYFLHYLEKRMKHQRDGLLMMSDEVDFLGSYFQTRLVEENMGIPSDHGAGMIVFEGPHNIIDHAMGSYGAEGLSQLDVKLPDNLRLLIKFLSSKIPNASTVNLIQKIWILMMFY